MQAVRAAALLSVVRCGAALSLTDVPIIGTQIKGTHLEVRPKFVGRCTHLQHALAETVVTYKMSGRTRVVMDVNLVINGTAKQYTQMNIAVTKCKDVVSEASCEPASPVVQREGICSSIFAPLMPWSDLISKIQPHPRCPIEEGNYTAHNFFIDMTGIDKLIVRETKAQQLEGYVWRARMLFFEHEAVHLCFEAVIEFVRVRNSAGRHGDRRGSAPTPSSTVQPSPA